MTLSKRIAVISMLLSFCTINNNAHAQLWRYLNDSPAKEKAADLAVERDASSVKEAIGGVDSFSYKIITYDLRSLEGKIYRVVTAQKPFTKILNISCGTDSLNIYDLVGVDSVHFLTKNLLEILYSPRGGSDDGFQNTMILCINKNKLHIAMEIESDHQFDGPGLWGEYYLTAKLTGQTDKSYQFSIKTIDRYHSKTHPSKNYNLHARFTVRFDARKKIFYNIYKNVDALINEWDDKNGKKSEKRITGYYPAIKLGSREYYYIGNIWYAATRWGGKTYIDVDYD